jgi:hypothetical protein
MSTVADIVGRAMRLIGVNDPNQAPSADDFATGMLALNAMCRRWEANGTSMGWQDVANPSDELPAPPEAEEAITYQLAMRIAPEYSVEPPAAVTAGAVGFLNELRRDRMVANPLFQRSTAPGASAGGRPFYNILTDTF